VTLLIHSKIGFRISNSLAPPIISNAKATQRKKRKEEEKRRKKRRLHKSLPFRYHIRRLVGYLRLLRLCSGPQPGIDAYEYRGDQMLEQWAQTHTSSGWLSGFHCICSFSFKIQTSSTKESPLL